jgi:predicted 3-demethylubiquinone-9 3-methyltransferase (glyoxalase superfamily)
VSTGLFSIVLKLFQSRNQIENLSDSQRVFVSIFNVDVLPIQNKEKPHMQKITPFLWFNDNAEEAVNFYVSTFKNSKLGNTTRYDAESANASGRPEGSVMTIDFQLEGQDFIALNGGPQFKFTEAISFSVDCKDQEEVDKFWETLSAGGEEGPCGWLKDKYGLSWQIVPTILVEMLKDKDPEKAKRVTHALMQMKKIDIAALQQAYEQG